MNKSIQQLVDEIEGTSKKLKELKAALVIVREICKHTWTFDCTGSHSTFYICRDCGEVKEE